MKRNTVLVALACMVFVLALSLPSGGEEASKTQGVLTAQADVQAESIYPIAPGVWYPQDGPLPEKPVRYYRARCFPGCHSGTKYGMYPDKPLDMKPIFPTSAFEVAHEKE